MGYKVNQDHLNVEIKISHYEPIWWVQNMVAKLMNAHSTCICSVKGNFYIFFPAGFILVVLVVWALFKGSLNDTFINDFTLDAMFFVEALSFVIELAGVVFLMLGYCCSRSGTSDDTSPIVTWVKRLGNQSKQLPLEVARGVYFHGRVKFFAMEYFSDRTSIWLWKHTIDYSLIV